MYLNQAGIKPASMELKLYSDDSCYDPFLARIFMSFCLKAKS
jgi:hypothetical protein